jgi:uncharacterized protein (TIGR02391 family)
MARRSAQPPTPPDIREFRTTLELDAAITKLRRRIADIEQLRADKVRRDDPRVRNVEHAVRDAIRELFGKDSTQFHGHAAFRINETPPTMMGMNESSQHYDHRQQEQFDQRLPDAIVTLEGLVEGLNEKRADLAQPHVAPRVAFQGRSLHAAIGSAAERLYLDGHYSQAVFESGKALIDLVKTKSGRHDLDGVALMQAVFSVNDPILAFNDRSDQSDRDEQQGMMHLYIGAAMGVRNPAGHRVGVIERGDRALQYLELFSLLADRLDDTNRVK